MKIEVKEFEFNGLRFFISKHPINANHRKIWSEPNVSPSEMKIVCKDLGDKRWMCRAEVPAEQAREFESWVEETMSERCLISKEFEHDPDGTLRRIYEIRGGDISDRTMLMLRWK
jgi:hypothetical protein